MSAGGEADSQSTHRQLSLVRWPSSTDRAVEKNPRARRASRPPGLNVGVDVATAAAAEPVAGLGTEASIWPGTGAAVTGPDVEPDVLAIAADSRVLLGITSGA